MPLRCFLSRQKILIIALVHVHGNSGYGIYVNGKQLDGALFYICIHTSYSRAPMKAGT